MELFFGYRYTKNVLEIETKKFSRAVKFEMSTQSQTENIYISMRLLFNNSYCLTFNSYRKMSQNSTICGHIERYLIESKIRSHNMLTQQFPVGHFKTIQ